MESQDPEEYLLHHLEHELVQLLEVAVYLLLLALQPELLRLEERESLRLE